MRHAFILGTTSNDVSLICVQHLQILAKKPLIRKLVRNVPNCPWIQWRDENEEVKKCDVRKHRKGYLEDCDVDLTISLTSPTQSGQHEAQQSKPPRPFSKTAMKRKLTKATKAASVRMAYCTSCTFHACERSIADTESSLLKSCIKLINFLLSSRQNSLYVSQRKVSQ